MCPLSGCGHLTFSVQISPIPALGKQESDLNRVDGAFYMLHLLIFVLTGRVWATQASVKNATFSGLLVNQLFSLRVRAWEDCPATGIRREEKRAKFEDSLTSPASPTQRAGRRCRRDPDPGVGGSGPAPAGGAPGQKGFPACSSPH